MFGKKRGLGHTLGHHKDGCVGCHGVSSSYHGHSADGDPGGVEVAEDKSPAEKIHKGFGRLGHSKAKHGK